jgi:hypothetical protein
MLNRLLCVAWIGVCVNHLNAADVAPTALRVNSAQPDEITNARFAGTEGWIGADGIYSVPLPDESTLWIFGDTLVGSVRDGKRSNMVMVNNTFAKERGTGADSKLQFFVNRDSQGKPTSYVVPKQGYYWLWDGVIDQGRLYIFTTRLTSPGTITAFDWTLLDQSLIIVSNPTEDPGKWQIQQLDFPFGSFTDDYEVIWGMEVLRINDELYIYGTARNQKTDPRSLVVARVSPNELNDFKKWTFYESGHWQSDSRRASGLTSEVGTEGSVTFLPDRKQFVYIYSPPLDPQIKMRTANSPVGPWSDAVTIYTCPETAWNPRVFCYAAKARIIPGRTNELLVSYATNSFDMLPDVLADERIYRPRFVRAVVGD